MSVTAGRGLWANLREQRGLSSIIPQKSGHSFEYFLLNCTPSNSSTWNVSLIRNHRFDSSNLRKIYVQNTIWQIHRFHVFSISSILSCIIVFLGNFYFICSVLQLQISVCLMIMNIAFVPDFERSAGRSINLLLEILCCYHIYIGRLCCCPTSYNLVYIVMLCI